MMNRLGIKGFKSISVLVGCGVGSQMVAFCDAKKAPNPADPLDCHNPVCNEKMRLFQDIMHQQKEPSKLNSSSSSNANASFTLKQQKTITPTPVALDCPLDRVELGQSAWNLLHTLAANFPDAPTEAQQKHALQFFFSLAHLYPCHICAHDFLENVTKSPPRVTSRSDLVMWVCEQHNLVNAKLNKPCFDCSLEKLDRRWRKGGEGCWDADKISVADEQEGDEAEPLTDSKENNGDKE